MPEIMIELDLSVPWEPPEPPAPRRLLRARWVAAAAVLAVTLGVLVSGGAPSGAGLLYTLDEQVLRAQTAGGRLVLARYQGGAPGPMIEARGLADGGLLWQRPAEVQQQIVTAGPDVVILMSEDRTGGGDSSVLAALDAATGRDLWARSHVRFSGAADGPDGGVIVVEEVPADAPVEPVPAGDPGVDRAWSQPERRILGLSARTGQPVWTVTVPKGSGVEFAWSDVYQGRVNRMDVLSGTGRLTRWDTRTGQVTATHQLAWSGPSDMFNAGWPDGTGRPSDRVVVHPGGEAAPVVYDLRTGRLLFRSTSDRGRGLFRCTEALFCSGGDAGLDAYDSTTGAHRWHLAGRDTAISFAGERLLVGSFSDPTEPGPVAIVDSRTGTVVKELPGWHVLTAGRRPLLWQAVDKRTSLLGALDPATGVVTVFASAENWFGNPECSVGDDAGGSALACVVVGGLSVWRLPRRR